MNCNNNIPQLRFPGFSGEWEEKPLSSFLHEHKTKSDGKCEVHSVSVTKGVVNQVEYLGRSFAAADTSKYNLVKPNDIIYTKSPTGAFPYGIVKQNKNPYNVIVSPLYAVYSPINKYVGYILDSYFESPERTNNYLSSLIQKGAKNTINITNDTFISKCMCLPSDPAEQQKIAECLSEIDILIEAQGEKVDALMEKKKGMMQQMFPQKGETAPRLRFPEFKGEWKEMVLSECLEERNEQFPEDDKYPLMAFIAGKGVSPKGEKYDRSALVKDATNKKYKRTELGDFIYSSNNLEVGSIGFNTYGSACISPVYSIFKSRNSIDSTFIGTLLTQRRFITEMVKYRQGVVYGQWKIPESEFLKMKVSIPSPAEQQKIAECLSAMDDMIASESEKLDALKDHKKGLMQQLFPQPNK